MLGSGAERERIARRVRALLADDAVDDAMDDTVDDTADAEVPAGAGDGAVLLRQQPARYRPGHSAAARRGGAAAEPGARWRIDPGRRTAAVVGVVVLIVAIAVGAWLVVSRPRSQSVAAVPVARTAVGSARSPSLPSSPATAATGAALVVVDVVGKVAHPGLYRIAPGSRVDDALRAAGGALPGTDLTGLNLARRVADGEQVAVGVPAAADPVASGSAAAAGPVDLNSASVQQLDALPGVGPVLAQHIVDWRTAHGSFQSVDQLRQVTGIGDAKFADLRPLVTV